MAEGAPPPQLREARLPPAGHGLMNSQAVVRHAGNARRSGDGRGHQPRSRRSGYHGECAPAQPDRIWNSYRHYSVHETSFPRVCSESGRDGTGQRQSGPVRSGQRRHAAAQSG